MDSEQQMSDIETQPAAAAVPAEHAEGAKHIERGRDVTPGEIVGTEEEFLAGKGTWTDQQGNIRAAVAGELMTDEHRKVSVIPVNMPPDIHEGSVVYGRIDEMFESVAFVAVEAVTPGKRDRVMTLSGVIPVSEIKDAFVQSIRDEMRVGDIVRAAVAKLTPFRLELTVKHQGMGVVKAFCSYDRQEMDLKGGMLVCRVCGQKETRHLGEPYGDMGAVGDVKLVARPRGPRREGGFGGRGGPRGGYGDRGPRREGGFGRGGPRGRDGDHGRGGRPGGPRGSFGGKRTFRSSSGGRGASQARY